MIPYGNYRVRAARRQGYYQSQVATPVGEIHPSSRAGQIMSPRTPDRSRLCYLEPLTLREQEVLDQLAHGISNREISEQLTISVRTVETHLNNIYGKLGVRGRVQAILRITRGPSNHRPVIQHPGRLSSDVYLPTKP